MTTRRDSPGFRSGSRAHGSTKGGVDGQADEARRLDIFGDAGVVRAIRSVQPFAFPEEAGAITGPSGEDAVGRSLEDERDNDPGFVLNTLWNVDKHRRLPGLAWVISGLWWTGSSEKGLRTAPLYKPLDDGQLLARTLHSR